MKKTVQSRYLQPKNSSQSSPSTTPPIQRPPLKDKASNSGRPSTTPTVVRPTVVEKSNNLPTGTPHVSPPVSKPSAAPLQSALPRPAPSTSTRNPIITPANKYAHVPSKVVPPPPRSPRVTTPSSSSTALTTPSHEDFFGVRKSQATTIVVPKKKRLSGGGKRKDLATEPSEPSDRSQIAPEESSIVFPTGEDSQPRPQRTTVLRSGSTSWKELVTDDAEDLPPRPSRSRSAPTQRNSSALGVSCDVSSIQGASSDCESHPAPGTILPASPARSSNGGSWLQWLSPTAPRHEQEASPTTATVFPVNVAEESRKPRWSIREIFGAPAAPQSVEASTYSAASMILSLNSDESVVEANRTVVDESPRRSTIIAFSESSLDAETPVRISEGSKKSVGQRSTPGQPSAPTNTPASLSQSSKKRPRNDEASDEGSRGRPSSRHSAAAPQAPPNTPISTNASSDASAQLQRSSTGRHSSYAAPAAPPNTPIGAAADENTTEVGATTEVISAEDGTTPRRSSWLASLLFSPTNNITRDESTQSRDGRPNQNRSFAAESVAPFDIPSPVPLAPTVEEDTTAGRDSDGGTSWFQRIRSSLLLRSPVHAHAPEEPNIQVPPEGGLPRRRKSVVFRSPGQLEQRVTDDVIAPPTNLSLSPPPILIVRNSSQGRLSSGANPDKESLVSRSGPPEPVREQASVDVAVPSPLPQPRHEVDSLGRVKRSKTPGVVHSQSSSRSSGSSSSPASSRRSGEKATASVSQGSAVVMSVSPPPRSAFDYGKPQMSPPKSSEIIENVLRTHSVASAIRTLTMRDIATFLCDNDVDFSPTDRKAVLIRVGRKLVMGKSESPSDPMEPSVAVSIDYSQSRKRHRSEVLNFDSLSSSHASRIGMREIEEVDDAELPDMSWTVAEMRAFAEERCIEIHGTSTRKADLLKQIVEQHLKNMEVTC